MNETLIKQLRWRYAAKKFDAAKKVSPENWKTLEQALILSPSSYGLQPYRFVVITNKELRLKLRECAYNQPQVTDASHLVVFAAKTKITAQDVEEYIALISKTRGVAPEKLAGFKDTMMGDLVNGPRSKDIKNWAARQCYIALGNLLTSAALLGIDACPMEGIDPPKFDEILELPKAGYAAVMAAAVGYRAVDDNYANEAKVRFAREKLVIEFS